MHVLRMCVLWVRDLHAFMCMCVRAGTRLGIYEFFKGQTARRTEIILGNEDNKSIGFYLYYPGNCVGRPEIEI